ncbi:MAG: ORF6N domain-containing protein [Bacteroidales bacterium]|nr:ORF6N domain-containing protein [Bacteroidales bacterium]
MENERALNPTAIESLIYEIRGQKVMLDRDLAKMYGVETKVLNQAVKRNMKRFPEDFMFQLTPEEYDILKSQFVTSSWGGTRKLPYVFTEQGLAMLSGLLNSDVAIKVNIAIMRTFVTIRNHLYTTQRFTAELEAIKAKLELLERNDEDNLEAINDLSEDMRHEIDTIYQAIAALSVKESPQKEPQRQKIGFKTQNSK